MFWKRILLSLGLFGGTALTALAVSISDIAGEVSEGSYSNFHINLFVEEGDSRGFTDGSSPRTPLPQHDLARDYIFNTFQAMGFETYLAPFTFNYSGRSYTGCNNVIAIKRGTSGFIHIIGAHYDSVDSGQSDVTGVCPGADDNASGVAGILETARAIQDYTFLDTIILIAFDGEEKGFFGSKHFVNNWTTTQTGQTNATRFLRANIKGMLSVDMIGYDDPTTAYDVILGTVNYQRNSPLSKALEDAAATYSGVETYKSSDWDLSDHKPFDDAGIESILVIEGDYYDYWNNPPQYENPYYHTPNDNIDQPNYISYAYATDVTRMLVGYLLDQAVVIPPATLWQTFSGSTVSLNWESSPGIAYDVYGSTNLIASNGWNVLTTVPSTPTITTHSVSFDLNAYSNRIFKVISDPEQ
ncbi:M28 family metallopeptidase [Pontiella agarivorans]|uniref:M20/M25/M40 family metallo-hydrolase n=1 Tax=Pontiella agarivorans TaxID=3038953 RepID=A0ABU5MVY4_9BACT|nr:M20/M25/M40 family metallo-hydrolase [Pontiella agarivorans]MDZ8118374.1 M20/M25/M40 family metallo-hydrolase [Pontiella agarivorans]